MKHCWNSLFLFTYEYFWIFLVKTEKIIAKCILFCFVKRKRFYSEKIELLRTKFFFFFFKVNFLPEVNVPQYKFDFHWLTMTLYLFANTLSQKILNFSPFFYWRFKKVICTWRQEIFFFQFYFFIFYTVSKQSRSQIEISKELLNFIFIS